MKCKNCGAELSGDEKFCGTCGMQLMTTNDAEPVQTVRFEDSGLSVGDVITAAHVRANMAHDGYKEAKNTLATLEAAYLEEEKALRGMLIGGVVFGLLLTSGTASSSANAFLYFFLFIACMVVAWGICGLKRYASNHGWFVVFNLTYAVIFLMLALFISYFIGIPYLIRTIKRTKEYKKAIEAAQEDVNQKYSQLNEMASA